MNRKTLTICLLAVAVTALGLWIYSGQRAWGQTSSGAFGTLKVGVCDPHKVVQQYKKKMRLQNTLDKEKTRISEDLQKKQQDIADKAEELRAGTIQAGSREYELRAKEILKLRIEYETTGKLLENELRMRDAQITQMCYEDTYKAIARIASERDIAIVFSQEEFSLSSQNVQELISKLYYRRPVLYSQADIDITGAVVDMLNSEDELNG